MKTRRAAFDFSPSLLHQRLVRQTRPRLVWDGTTPVKTWQRRLRRRLAQLLGFDLMPTGRDRPPLNVRTLWQREHHSGLGTVERLVFTAERGADVPAYVCLPHKAVPPYRWAICLQGHTSGMHNSIAVAFDDERTPIKVPGDRDFAVGAMRRGWAALCLEQRSFGLRAERRQRHVDPHNGCHDAAMHALMLGRTLVGERVYDVDRGIDYLATRRDVDMQRLLVMGNSGGGTVTLYAAALLPRVAAAMPSCSFATYAGSIMSIYHCGDNYIPGLLREAEAGDVLGLFAPKPVVVVAGQRDAIFPLPAVRRAFAQARRIYAAAGAADRCRLVVGPGGHRFYAPSGWAALRQLLD